MVAHDVAEMINLLLESNDAYIEEEDGWLMLCMNGEEILLGENAQPNVDN